MPTSELRKQVDEMHVAFNSVVKAATEPVLETIENKFSELQSAVITKLNELNRLSVSVDNLSNELVTHTEAIDEIKRATDELSKELKVKREGPSLVLLDSLSIAFDKYRWEENIK
ncbi:MAG: hypothetical protein WCG61_04075 [Chlorobium sp.]